MTEPAQSETPATWKHKHLLGLQGLDAGEIQLLLDTANSFIEVSQRSIKKVPALRGKSVVNLFFEPSTRTRMSFELAAKRLSADTLNISTEASSLSKGESIMDMVRNLEALKVDTLIVRHASAGVPAQIAQHAKASVINAGDGAHEHPTQALLDIVTMQQHKGSIKGLKVCIIGDITHSRVARSNIWGLKKLGAEVTLCAPPTLLPVNVASFGVDVTFNIEDVLGTADVIMLLRMQHERQELKAVPSLREYRLRYGLDRDRLQRTKEDVLIMHPGPLNRGVEIDSFVADGPRSVILDQVTNGLAVRMAALFLVTGGAAT